MLNVALFLLAVALKPVFFLYFLLPQQVARHAAHGEPDGEDAGEEDGEEDEEDVGGTDADGVGIDDEGAFAGAELDDAELHLQPA